MLKAIFAAVVISASIALSATVASANYNPDPAKGTVVVRVNSQTGDVAIMSADHTIKDNTDAQNIAKAGTFVALVKQNDDSKSELDQGSHAQESDYAVYAGFGQSPNYCFGWSCYNPVYGYNYGFYNYYYYTPYPWYSGWGGYNYGYAPAYFPYYRNYWRGWGGGYRWGGFAGRRRR